MVCLRCCWRSLDTSYRKYLKYTYNIHEASDYENYLETSQKTQPETRYINHLDRSYKNYSEKGYGFLQESVTENTAESSKLRSCNMCLGLSDPKCFRRQEFYKFNSSSLDSFAKQLRKTSNGRRLFATEVSLGFGPNIMRTGDSVWLLESQRVPFILREHASDTCTFEFIGACYLHEAARDHDLCARCGAEVPRLLNEWQTINIR